MIQCQFSPIKEDYTKTNRHIYRRQLWWVSLFYLYAIAQSACLVVAIIEGTFGLGGYILLPFLFIIFSLPILIYILTPVLQWKRVEKDTVLLGPYDYTYSEENVTLNTPVDTTTSEWSMYSRFDETEEHFLLFLTFRKSMFHIVPKRGFHSPEDINDFRELLVRKNLKMPTKKLSLDIFKENKKLLLIPALILPNLCLFGCAIAALIYFSMTEL